MNVMCLAMDITVIIYFSLSYLQYSKLRRVNLFAMLLAIAWLKGTQSMHKMNATQ